MYLQWIGERLKFLLKCQKLIPGKEYRLNISSKLKNKEIWAEEGFEISWAQFELSDWYVNPKKVVSKTDANLTENQNDYLVFG